MIKMVYTREDKNEQIRVCSIKDDRNSFKVQQLAFIILMLAAVVLLTSCGGKGTEANGGDAVDIEQKTFTREELAEFDGQDGRAAYIAVDGIVYDVTDVSEWQGGTHAKGRFMAGKDYSDEIKNVSPHGTGMLSRATEVGVLID